MGVENNIPEDWIETSIGNLVDLAQGVAINAKTKHVLCNEKNGIPLLKINNLLNNTIDQFADPKLVPKKSIINKDDVIFTRTGQVGEVLKNKFGILHNNSFKVIPSEKLHWNYLYWFLKNKKVYNYVQKVAAGSVQKDLNHSAFKTIPFKYPVRILEQKAIAKVLTAFDDKIQLLQAQNKTLETMAQTIFKEWFGNKLFDGKVVRLGDIVSIRGGYSYKGKELGMGSSLLLGMGCVSYNQRFLTKGARLYADNVPEKFLSTPGEIVLATRQQSENLPILGFPAIIPEEFKGRRVFIGTNLYKVINNSFLNNETLFSIFRSKAYRNHILKNSSGTTVKMITKDSVESFEFKMPNKNTVDQYQKTVKPLIDKLKTNNIQIQSLTKTRDTLLPKLMSGQVRVKNLNQTVDA